MKERRKVKKIKISAVFGEQGTGKESSIFVLGNREMSVCGCKKVVNYSPELVRLENCDGYLDITGHGLTIASCFGSEIKLSGSICEIKFSGGDKK